MTEKQDAEVSVQEETLVSKLKIETIPIFLIGIADWFLYTTQTSTVPSLSLCSP
jgi:hypothetical protein